MAPEQDVPFSVAGTRWEDIQSNTCRASIESPSDNHLLPTLNETIECTDSTGTRRGYILAEPTLFKHSQYSDMTILLGPTGIILPVHRLVIALRSPLLPDQLDANLQDEIHQITWQRSTVHTAWEFSHTFMKATIIIKQLPSWKYLVWSLKLFLPYLFNFASRRRAPAVETPTGLHDCLSIPDGRPEGPRIAKIQARPSNLIQPRGYCKVCFGNLRN
jgi:hypothetical protein